MAVWRGGPLGSRTGDARRVDSQPPVDVVFLDIDGVLCPFGGVRDGFRKDALTYVDGCIFPDCTMDALTNLLRSLRALTVEASPSTNSGARDEVVARGDPVLVLSSTWRAQPRFIEDILHSFRAYVYKRGSEDASVLQTWDGHLEAFFDIVDPNFHATRHEEIYSWIKSNAQSTGERTFIVRSWIALDDEDLVNVEGKVAKDATKHAVQTQSSMGLSGADVELGVRLAKTQIEEFHGLRSRELTELQDQRTAQQKNNANGLWRRSAGQSSREMAQP